jgi:SARP family transcriptional regulator, regulator of embCAB operon
LVDALCRHARVVLAEVGATLADSPTRVQLCGPLAVEVCGRRVEAALPGRQGRLLLAYLAVNRQRPVSRDELVDAVWGERLAAGADAALTVLLSKTRTALRPADVHGRGELRLALPPDAWIDVEAALEAVHRAESAVTQGRWAEAWGAAKVGRYVATRRFLAGQDAAWVETWRRRLADVLARSLEAHAAASLGVGGTELATAERACLELIERAPFRESGYRLLMEVKAARGNIAEALHVYERLRVLLREELGVAPSPAVQAVHRRLLLESAPD